MEAVRRERKVVTVVFADLLGFTARAEVTTSTQRTAGFESPRNWSRPGGVPKPTSNSSGALAFFRSVGASRYVREGEALLAASA
jgi:hypothetical protein